MISNYKVTGRASSILGDDKNLSQVFKAHKVKVTLTINMY